MNFANRMTIDEFLTTYTVMTGHCSDCPFFSIYSGGNGECSEVAPALSEQLRSCKMVRKILYEKYNIQKKIEELL